MTNVTYSHFVDPFEPLSALQHCLLGRAA